MSDKYEEWELKIFSKRLNEQLDKQNMNQSELAEKCGLSPAAVSRYVNGERTPNATHLVNIAKALDVSCDYLTGISLREEGRMVSRDDVFELIANLLKDFMELQIFDV